MAEATSTSRARQLAGRVGVDRAVAYTITGRVLTLGGGVIAAAFVVRFLTQVEQGFHYTFLSLLTAQAFFELGFAYTTMQLAAHEKARLAWAPDSTLVGDAHTLGRLASLLRLTLRWTLGVSVLFVVCFAPAGLWFFGRAAATGVTWQVPWLWLVMATALTLAAMPVLALLEGCGLVARVAAVRSAATMASQLTLCTSLALGAGLHAAPMAATAAALVQTGWLLTRGRLTLASLLRAPLHRDSQLDWGQDIWPLQWRLGLSWLSGFFIYYAFNPILFSTVGPVEAGRFGLALSVSGTVSAVGLAWISTRIPAFTALIAGRRFEELDHLFGRSLRQAIWVATVLASVLIAGVFGLAAMGHPVASRIVAPGAFLALVLAALANLVASSEGAYLRAWRRDPFLGISLLAAGLVTTTSLAAARFYGTTGVAVAYLGVMSTVMLAGGHTIYLRKRSQWQQATS